MRTLQLNDNAKRKVTQQRSRAKRRLDAILALGGSCSSCKIDNPIVLEFDHIRPIQWRTNNIVKLNGQHNVNTINAMVTKGQNPHGMYQLLCANCHKIKTHNNKDYIAKGTSDERR